jgi:NitT/TauT family transport system substrate-binding protein
MTHPSRPIRSRAIAAVAALVVAALALAGCARDGELTVRDGRTELTVGVLPNLDVAPIYLGVEKGFFEEQGLSIRLELAQGGAALIPSVLSGQYQFGFSNAVSLIVGRDKGLPVRMVAAGSESTNQAPDISAVLVRGDSAFRSAKDLEGAVVAVNLLNSSGSITVRQSVRKAGGDPDKVRFVELGFADMLPALAAGRVDAAFSVEPFITSAVGAGDRVLTWNYLDTGERTVSATYFTAGEFLQSNPEIVTKFQAALEKSREYAQANPAEVRAIVGTYTDIDPAVLEKVTLPVYPKDINAESIVRQAELALADGVIGKPLEISTLLP